MGTSRSAAARRNAISLLILLTVAASALLAPSLDPAVSEVVSTNLNQTTTLAPLADTYVSSNKPTTSFGKDALLKSDALPVTETYVRFNLKSLSGTVLEAHLRLHVADVSYSQSPDGGALAVLNDNSWTEAGTTYDTRPTRWGATVAALGPVARNTWIEIPVTGALTTGRPVTFGIRSTSDDGASYDSRQAAATRPELIVTTGAAPTTTTSTATTTSSTSTSSTSTTTTTTSSPPAQSVIRIAAVGDTTCATGSRVTASECRQLAVSNLVADDTSIRRFLALGDLAYENGSAADFQNAYGPSYGRFKSITMPTIGNHEYGTSGANAYFSYFGSAAGDPSNGWYSYDIGSSWHVVTLNSNCGPVSCSANGAQVKWLRADLAANTKPCLLATWHHPRFSSGEGVGNEPAVAPFWDVLQQHGADIALAGHVHNYERFAPQLSNGTASADGIREFIVGTGGRSLFGFEPPMPNSNLRLAVFGILKLDLGSNGYSWKFVDERGSTRDSGTGTCH